MNVNIYDNGFGTVAQGSFYPDIELSESQACVTDLQILLLMKILHGKWDHNQLLVIQMFLVWIMVYFVMKMNSDTVDVECVDNTD